MALFGKLPCRMQSLLLTSLNDHVGECWSELLAVRAPAGEQDQVGLWEYGHDKNLP
jgi:hypothetical protein